MAAGDLSSDQSRFVDLLVQATGLDRTTAVAWVGSESGWGITKPGHNYLNVGPGETYKSTELAAARTGALINTSANYAGIRTAIPAGGAAQVKAIGASRWGTSATLIQNVYSGLAGKPASAQDVNFLGDAAGAVGKGLDALGNALDKGVSGATGAVTGAVGDAVSGVANDVITGIKVTLLPLFFDAGLGIVFTVAAFAFITMGVNRLTGQGVTKVFNAVSGAVGTAAGAAKLAAI